MITFSPTTGRLRLDPDTFEVLTSASNASGTVPVDLRGCQAWTTDGPHPLLLPALAADRSPLCQLRVTLSGPDAHSLHQLWVSPEAAAVLAHVEGEQYDLFAVAPGSVHASLARLLRLGPRRRASPPNDPVRASVDLLGEVVHAAVPADRIAALTRLFDEAPDATRTRWAAAAAAGTWRASVTEVVWPGPHGLAGRSLTLLDSPAGMLSAAVRSSGTVVLVPVTATDIWTILATLLPRDDELASS